MLKQLLCFSLTLLTPIALPCLLLMIVGFFFSQIPYVQIGHCYRETNSCADFLARIGSCQNSDFILYNDLPMDLLELLSSDLVGLYCNRLVLVPLLPP